MFSKNYLINTKELIFNAHNQTVKVTVCVVELLSELLEDCSFLSDYELDVFRQIEFDTRRKSFLLGRIAAKNAISHILKTQPLNKIEIRNGALNQPIVEVEKQPGPEISISHCGRIGVAAAFSHNILLGVDIEKISEERISTLQKVSTENESLLLSIKISSINRYTILWTAREALSKCVKTGFTIPFHFFEIKALSEEWWGYSGEYLNFEKFKFISILLQDSILTLCFPTTLILQEIVKVDTRGIAI